MNVGDYVRTKYGIAKIIDLEENPYGEKTIYVLNKSIINIYDCNGSQLACLNPLIEDMQDRFDTKFGDEKCIIKSSPNIIDLIEVGDYVNGVLVESIYQREKDKLYIHSFDTEIMMCITNNNIKSIVTKEQFEAIKYEIK